MVLLKVVKGYFDEPADNEPVVFLKLPADDGQLSQAIEAVGAVTAEECVFTSVNCVIPWLNGSITDLLESFSQSDYDIINELARQIRRLEQRSELVTFKAMLEVVPMDIGVEEVLDLSYQVEGFTLIREAKSSEDYARNALLKSSIEEASTLFVCTDLNRYREVLMDKKGISITEYGALYSLDGQTIEQFLSDLAQANGMEMK